MATAWLTYAWADNDDGDVDFVAQELVRAGVQVKLDRWNLGAGERLWGQIAYFIQDSDECVSGGVNPRENGDIGLSSERWSTEGRFS